jgi:hypothetical protein
MNANLLKGLIALIPASLLFSGSIIVLSKGKTVASYLQLLGAGCLVLVAICHIFEGLHLLPWMNWGLQYTVGHYVDLWSAVIGLTLFPLGYFFHALAHRHASNRPS